MPAPDEIAPPGGAISRRRFLLGAAALSGAALLELTGCAGPLASPSPPRWIRLNVTALTMQEPAWVDLPPPPAPTAAVRPAPSQTPPGASEPPAPGSGGAWLVLAPDGTVTAFDPRCTHAACLYDWDPANQRFDCRCHDGWFDLTGKVISGPPPRPLNRMKVRQAGPGEIEVGWQDVPG